MTIVGVDIGGTNTRLVAINDSGVVLARTRLHTSPEQGASQTIGTIIEAVQALIEDAAAGPIRSLGIGISGPVDVNTGVVSNPFTLGGWPPTDLRAPFSSAFNVPIAIDNDANVAAVGEWWHGSGRGSSRMAMVTIGTGIGVAMLLNGRVQRSADGRHGEAGHMVLDPNGLECYCGARGCWEVLASGTALGRYAKELALHEDGLLRAMAQGNPERVTSTLLFAAAAAGDNAAGTIIEATAVWVGLGLVNLASTVMPDLFVLSGGVMDHLELMRGSIETVMRQHSVMVPSDVPIVAAELGDDAGAVGAAKQALELVAG